MVSINVSGVLQICENITECRRGLHYQLLRFMRLHITYYMEIPRNGAHTVVILFSHSKTENTFNNY